MTLDEQIAAAEKAAEEAALTPEEQKKADGLARLQAAQEKLLAAGTARRAIAIREREEAARAKVKPGTLILGIDLVACFMPGKAPPEDQLPGRGVIVVRNATHAEAGDFVAEFEANRKHVPAMSANLIRACVVDPDPKGSPEEFALVHAFVDMFPDAAMIVASAIRRLGGAKVEQTKRGVA